MILVVDDELGVTQFRTEALAVKGYSVVQAEDGEQAYAHVRNPDCRMLLLDLQMPRLNGFELLERMKKEGIDLPVIIMTGLRDLSEEALRALPGAVKILHKPFDLDDLYHNVKDVLADAGETTE